jgi:hypothetical protein
VPEFHSYAAENVTGWTPTVGQAVSRQAAESESVCCNTSNPQQSFGRQTWALARLDATVSSIQDTNIDCRREIKAVCFNDWCYGFHRSLDPDL